MNLRLIVAMSLLCTFTVFVHGMKRDVAQLSENERILPANGQSLPQEIVEKIFTYLCHTPLGVSRAEQSYFFSFGQLIAPNSIVGCLAKMRSVCKHWYDNLLTPEEIKYRLKIRTDHIVNDLDNIKVFENKKNYSHAQFLAEMIRDTHNACKHLVPSKIRDTDDIPKFKIFHENGLLEKHRLGRALQGYNNHRSFMRTSAIVFVLLLVSVEILQFFHPFKPKAFVL